MTTIIVDRVKRRIISDLQTTSGDLKYPTKNKIYRLRQKGTHNECLVGVCGEISEINVFMSWFRNNWWKPVDKRDPPPENKTDAICVVLFPDGTAYEYFCSWYPEEIVLDFMAYGSGRELVLGAMLAGATAEEAMKIAERHDKNTGFGIQIESFDGNRK